MVSIVPSLHDVRRYGAEGDRAHDDTQSIQRAIDACVPEGGGMVYVGPGDYLCGRLRLRSHVTLYLASGCTLWAADDPAAYGVSEGRRHGALLEAEDADDVTICGPGTLYGTGEEDWGRRPGDTDGASYGAAPADRDPFRIGIIEFRRCRDVAIRDVTIRFCDWWTVVLDRCERALVHGITILNNPFHLNSDGVDLVSCRDVRISDCHITAGDDCICPKTDGGDPCEHIVVTNCTLESIATAIKLGTGSHGDFHDLYFSNCTIRNSCVGIGIFVKDGALVERVSFADISISTLEDPASVAEYLQDKIYPIFVDVERRFADSPIGIIRDLSFRNIQISSDNGILVQGMRESPIQNLSLQGVSMRVPKGYEYAGRIKHHGGLSNPDDDRITQYARQPSYVTLAHVDLLSVDDLRVLVDEDVHRDYDRRALSVHEGRRVSLRGIVRLPAGPGREPVVYLERCRQVLLSGCLALPGTGTFVGVAGTGREDLSLAGNDLHAATEEVRWGVDVSEDVASGGE